MNKVTPPYLLQLCTSSFLTWKIKNKEKKLYLTFDDGPTPGVTCDILNILKKYGVKATFFCVGEKVRDNPELFSKIKKERNIAGNHTFSHLNGWKTPTKEYIADTLKAGKLIKSNLFRPPYGRVTPAQISSLQKEYKIIMWSLLSGDFKKQFNKEKCLDNVLKNTLPGSIVVFHDSEKAAEKCFYALPRFLETFLEKGFCFEVL